MNALGPTRLTVRGLRQVPGVSVLIALLVLVSALLAIGAPRLTLTALTSAVRHDLVQGAANLPLETNVVDTSGAGIAGVWSRLPSRLAVVRRPLANLGGLIQPGEFAGIARGPQGRGFPGSGTSTTIQIPTVYTLEAAPSLRDESRLASGRWPRPAVAGQPIEVVIASKAAATLKWKIGQTQTLAGTNGAKSRSVVLVGIVTPRDSKRAFWSLDSDRGYLGTHVSAVDGVIDTYYSTIWVDAGSWPTLAPQLTGRSISAWYGIDTNAVTADQATDIAAEVRRFTSLPVDLGLKNFGTPSAFTSGLPSQLEAFTVSSAPSTALIALFELGPAGALAAVLLVGLRLLQSRRAGADALIRARGASGAQVRLLAAAEVAVWTVPAAIIGGALAVLLTPGSGSLGVASAVALVCALVAPIMAALLADQTGGRNGDSVVARVAVPAIEGAAVLLAVLALVVLVARGPVTASSGVDPLVEVAPLLLAIAVTVVVARITPFVTRWVGAVQRRGRGAVSLVAASGVGIARRGGVWVLFALVVGVGMSVFSLTMVATQQHGVEQAALNRTGSDLSVSASDLSAATVRELGTVRGVVAHATVQEIEQVTVPDSDLVGLYSVDPAALASVQRGIDHSALAVVKGANAVVENVDAPPATAILDATGSTELRLHSIQPHTVSLVFTEPEWVLVDRATASSKSFSPVTVGVFLRLRSGADPATAEAAVKAVLARSTSASDSTVYSAASTEASILGTPLDRAVHTAILAATIVTALLCLLVFVITLAAGAAERLRRGAILRAIGFDRRQAALLVLADVVPVAVIGVVAGTLTGIGLAAVVLHTIDPDDFIGAPIALPLVVNAPTTALALAGFLVAAVLAAGVAILLDLARPVTAGLQTLGEER